MHQAVFGTPSGQNSLMSQCPAYVTYGICDLAMEGKRLYVGNLTYSVNEGQLRDLFSQYGDVVSAKVIEQKGFGFVEMGTSEEAQSAMDSLNQTVFEGRTLRIDEARPMQPRRDFDRGGFGGSGRRY